MKTLEKQGRSGASLIEETVYTKEKGNKSYYVDRLINGQFAVSLHEFYITTFTTKEEAIKYVDRKVNK